MCSRIWVWAALLWMILGVFIGNTTFAQNRHTQGTGMVPQDLATLKNWSAARESSYDRTGGNADGMQDFPIQVGETRVLADIEGAGMISHIWMTVASGDPKHLRNLVLRMYWDGETEPSVETPIGDFFGLGHGRYYHFASAMIQIGTLNALNCFWPMPFSNGAKITVTNEGPIECSGLYYYIDFRKYTDENDGALLDQGRFHAQYRQEFPCEDGEYLILDAVGRGHYVGCNLSIQLTADGWWGEGDDMFYIDGATTPTMNGTGSEDYFCGAWCYGAAFGYPYFGCPLRGEHVLGAYWNVYRHHILDPVPFRENLRLTIEHGHANDRKDYFSSVAYWYQTEPHKPFPAFPVAAERTRKVSIPTPLGAMDAELFVDRFSGGPIIVQDLKSYGDNWSGDAHLWFICEKPTTYSAEFSGSAKTQKLEIWYTAAPDYGMVEIWLNGVKVSEWDGYSLDGVMLRKTETIVEFKDGKNTVELRVVGKNRDSSGFYAGVDAFRLSDLE